MLVVNLSNSVIVQNTIRCIAFVCCASSAEKSKFSPTLNHLYCTVVNFSHFKLNQTKNPGFGNVFFVGLFLLYGRGVKRLIFDVGIANNISLCGTGDLPLERAFLMAQDHVSRTKKFIKTRKGSRKKTVRSRYYKTCVLFVCFCLT